MWIEKKGMVQWYRIFNRNKACMIRILSMYVAGERRAEISPLIPLAKGLPNSQLRTNIKRHLADEVRHAQLLENRIRELGGELVDIPSELEPQEFFFKKEGNLKAWLDLGDKAKLTRKRVIEVLLFNSVLEATGVSNFYAHAEATREADPQTYYVLMELFPDEIRHAIYTQEYAYRLAGPELYDFARATHERFRDAQQKHWATLMRLMLERLIPRSVTGMSAVEHAAWMAIARRQERLGVSPVDVVPMPIPERLVNLPPPYGMSQGGEIRELILALDREQDRLSTAA